jgi:hypothetical protein
MAKRIVTRDYYMVMLINGVTKAGAQRDVRKHASRVACRGKDKMTPAQKIKVARTFDWTRPALHGDELFEIGVNDNGDIVAAAIIDEEGNAIPFNLISFNEAEMSEIREMSYGD